MCLIGWACCAGGYSRPAQLPPLLFCGQLVGHQFFLIGVDFLEGLRVLVFLGVLVRFV